MKKILATITAAGLLTFAGAGAAFAADDSPTTTKPAVTGRRAEAERPYRRRYLRHRVLRAAVKTAAATIGVQPRDLVEAVRGGQTIAQFAQSKGVDPQTVIDALVKKADAKVDQLVQNGTITAQRGNQVKERIPGWADRIVNSLPKHRAAGASGQTNT